MGSASDQIMYLSIDAILPYLVQRGLIDTAQLTTGVFSVRKFDGLRPVFVVDQGHKAGLVIKQPSSLDRDRLDDLDREAAFYSLIQEDSFAAAKTVVTPFVD